MVPSTNQTWLKFLVLSLVARRADYVLYMYMNAGTARRKRVDVGCRIFKKVEIMRLIFNKDSSTGSTKQTKIKREH